ncbi:hypothetical protein SASPL_150255 [Salvia splendens]|uniref:Protein kinase domain-containing protein n=1 Tax=Salvia splendens TaxID=180675 RepID=A0A8X8W6I6_SALSN|nr:hypothetical protein SASPL_150255 [Salvia splendens]
MNLLGAGRFRSVYKGTINDDDERTKVVAVKHGFMANGSLDNRLHSNFENEDLALSAIQRLNNAIDIASGVEYLHCGTDSIVIHGDLKPSNILLDKDMVAKIVSQILASTEGSSSSAIKGTIGYIAPVVDPFLHQELKVDEKYRDCIASILRIGVRCSKQLPRDCMSMTDVVNDLKKIRNVFPVYRNGGNVASYQH